jgi:1,2-diacylglycerol 3-alpha-glucosyltransferase
MPSVQVTVDNRLSVFIPPEIIGKIWDLDLDVVHTHTEFTVGSLGWGVAKMYGLPQVHTMHTIYEDYTHFVVKGDALNTIAKPAARLLTRSFSNSANKVIVPTNKIKDLLLSYGGKSPMAIIPTGIELDMFSNKNDSVDSRSSLREQYGIAPTDKVLLFLGRISKEKNIDELLNVLAGYLPQKPNVKFLLVGGGSEVDELKQLSNELGISEQVIFAGKKPWDEIGRYYHMGDIFINASQSETQGLTYIEALASGMPVVAKADRVLDDVLIEGKNGFIFTDKTSLLSALDTLLNDDSLRHEMGIAAAKSVEKFTGAHYARAVSDLYSEITSDWKYPYREYKKSSGDMD